MTFLLRYWPYILAAIILTATALYIFTLQQTNKTLTAKLSAAEAKVNLQNAAIDAMRTESEQRLKAAQAALQAAKKVSDTHKAKATSLLQRPAPTVPACEAADNLLNEFLK